ncbi:serpin-ZX-like [Silene latifolia]|uniref:serpin-ZX-like n=1 Tax=Silene latifolia TaxID=37657 RepID=UPI003D7791C8
MNFSVQVAKHVIQENLGKGESVICSPASIDAVLRILAVGSEKSTRKQLLNLFGHDNIQELNAASTELAKVFKASENTGTLEVSYVNGLWLDQRLTLNAEFEKVLREVHNARARVVDFVNQADEAVKEANLWTKKETKGLINDRTVLLLANALYFKGLTLPFKLNCKDFSEMINAADPVYVSDMFQKCYVETNEHGTEAAAVTYSSIDGCGYEEEALPEINFVANHLFMFMIREDVSGALLFIGTMLNPE